MENNKTDISVNVRKCCSLCGALGSCPLSEFFKTYGNFKVKTEYYGLFCGLFVIRETLDTSSKSCN